MENGDNGWDPEVRVCNMDDKHTGERTSAVWQRRPGYLVLSYMGPRNGSGEGVFERVVTCFGRVLERSVGTHSEEGVSYEPYTVWNGIPEHLREHEEALVHCADRVIGNGGFVKRLLNGQIDIESQFRENLD